MTEKSVSGAPRPRFFTCCLISGLCQSGDPCWHCEENTISFSDGDLVDEFKPYNGFSSRGYYYQFSKSIGENPFEQELSP